MACNPLQPTSCAGEFVQDGLAAIAKGFADGATEATKTLMTAWTKIDSPELGGAGSASAWLQDRTSWLVLGVAILSVFYAAYRMATTGRFEAGADLAKSLGKLLAVVGCTTFVATAGLEIGDAYSAWILRSTDDFSTLIAFNVLTKPAVTMLLAVVVLLTQLIQIMLLFAKNACVVALVGVLNVSAAATNTSLGNQAFLKHATWLLAWILYKPTAATIYALAFKMSGDGKSLQNQLSGLTFMVLAIVALPALMRFLVPAAAAVAGGNAGAIAAATVAGGLATGAAIFSGGAAAAGFSGVGAASPSGAAGQAGGLTPALQSATSGAQLAGSGSSRTDEVVDKP